MNEKITELPLQGKYLKYSPEITFDIFKLVWDKLISLGYYSYDSKSAEYRYKEFIKKYPYFRETFDTPLKINCYDSARNFKETTVQEILGYNPFETFTLPEKWCIEVTKDNQETLTKWRTNGDCTIGAYLLSPYHPYNYDSKVKIGYSVGYIPENTIKITFEQFQEYVLKETMKETMKESEQHIPEYIECIKPQSSYFIPGTIYKVINTDYMNSCEIISNIRCGHYEANNKLYVSLTDTSYFKPSTKEAFDSQIEKEPVRLSFYVKYCDEFTEDLLKSLLEWCQKNNTLKDRGRNNSFEGLKKDGYFLFDNFGLVAPIESLYKDRVGYGYGVDNNRQDCLIEYSIKDVKELINYKEPKSIEKWNIGSYVVCIERYTEKFKVGDIGKIEGSDYKWIDISNSVGHPCLPDKARCKWFATKSEAEEFAKTLVQPIKEEVKQVVHCKNKEEWDFVLSKLPPTCLLSKQSKMFEEFIKRSPSGVVIDTVEHLFSDIEYWKEEGYQILSFQEWCKLNNYIMDKKKYTIKELETNSKLLIYIDSKEEHDKIKKVSKRICTYHGNYCYSLYLKTYSSQSSKSYPDAYDKDSIILTIDDIIFEDSIKNDDKEILNESSIGKYISFNYNGRFYDEAFIIKENGYIYVLNNCYSNNDGHSDESIYKYSLKFKNFNEVERFCKDIKFLDFEDIKFRPLCPNDLKWEIQVPQIKTHGIMWCEPAPMTKDNWKNKMTLSIDDEELPMVSIIKTNTIKQLLNND